MEKRLGLLIRLALACCVLSVGGATLADEMRGGQLKLAGEHVERLVLVDENGRQQTYSGEELTGVLDLASGTYRPQEIHLKGGYRCTIWSEGQFAPVKVGSGEVTELKVGAPLTQGLTVERQGKAFLLHYELKGIGGETYAFTDRSIPPGFAVYKGDRKIGSGKFEFG